MDDTPLANLPDDPALLHQMLREQQATVVTLLKQREAAREGQAHLEERYGELEHDYGQLQQKHAELQQRNAEPQQPSDPSLAELLTQREARIAELEKKQSELTKELETKIKELELDKLRLAHQLDLLKKRYYGPRADRVTLGQLLLEFAADLESRPVNPQDLPQDLPAGEAVDLQTVRRVKRGRRNLKNFENLPTVRQVHDLPEDQRVCADGHAMVKIGEEVTFQIERAPGFFYRLEHVQIKYACVTCDEAGETPQITLAEKPLQPIEKGMAGPGLLAYVVTSKYADFLPLYRLENIFRRDGFEIDRSTLCVWAGDVADLVKPVYDLMIQRVLQSHVIGTDDTVLPMLAPEKCRQARMWIYRGDGAHPHNVFDFTTSRKRDGPASFLKGYNQVLLADAYGGYDGIAIEKDIVLAGCWAHGRRHFIDSQDLCPQIAGEALVRIRRLFAIEEPIKGRPAAERLAVRQERSVPVLAELHELLLARKDQLVPKHPVAQAIGYVLNQWEPLNTFAADGAVDLDNNLAEQEMKRIAMGRKAFLFVGNERGGRTAAILSSLTSTCRRHGVDPQFYFTQLLTNLPTTPMSQVEDWLPDAFKRRGLDPAVAYAEALSSLRR
jgi:transposase